MKKFSWISFKHLISKINIKNYLRELSLVVMGIIITFGGAYLIDKKADKKEYRNIMAMVQQELTINLQLLETFQKEIASEIDLYLRIKSVNFQHEQLDEAEIDLLFDELPIIRSFNYQSAAYEVFCTSNHIHSKNNESITFNLIRTYQNLESVAHKLNIFYTNKERVLWDQTESLNPGDWDKFAFGDISEYLGLLLKSIKVKNFIWSAHAHFEDDDLSLTKCDIISTIEIINCNNRINKPPDFAQAYLF